MNNLIECTTLDQFNKALKDGDIPIVRKGRWDASGSAQVRASDSAQVTASGSAQVRASGSAQVTAYDSAQVTASGSAQVRAYGSAQVRAYDSAQVRAYDSAQVRAYDSAQVTAYDSAQVTAKGHVAITSQSDTVKVAKSKTCTLIKVPKLEGLDNYLDRYPIHATKSSVTLYKAVSDNMRSLCAENKLTYPAKGTITNDKLDPPGNSCANGLHFAHFDWAVNFGQTYGKFVILKARVPRQNPATGADNIIVSPDSDGKVRCGIAEIIEVITDWQHYDPEARK